MKSHIGLIRTSAPANIPVDLDVAKSYLRVDGSDDDDLITLLIEGITEHVEDYTGLALINQTWQQWYDSIPEDDEDDRYDRHRYDENWDGLKEGPISLFSNRARSLELLKAPVSSVSSVKSYAEDDTESTFSTDNYRWDNSTFRNRIVLVSGATWPTALRNSKAVVVETICGYGATEASVPSDIKTAILQTLAVWYEDRCAGTDLSMSSKAILDRYRRFSI